MDRRLIDQLIEEFDLPGPMGDAPMEGAPMGGGMPMEGAPQGPPMDAGAPEMPMGMDMPMEMPMDEGMGAGGELPSYATVIDIEPGSVILIDEYGQELALPEEAFPFEVQVGMTLAQAEVVSLEDGAMVAQVVNMEDPVEIPADVLGMDFEIGDLFWYPEPPAGPEAMEEEFETMR